MLETGPLAVDRSAMPEVQEKLRAQSAALRGERGALLWAVSARDGRKLAERKLDAVPVFDGMAAANGRLYLATQTGCVVCLARAE